MRHTTRLLGAGLALVAFGTLNHAARAQVISNAVSYDSLNAPLSNASLITTQGGQRYLNAGSGAQQVESGGQGAYNVLNTFAAPGGAVRFSSTDIGGGVSSTTLLADDLHLQVSNAGFPANGTLQSYTANTLAFLLTNANDTALTVTAHVRIYNNDGFGNTITNATNGNGDYAGTLLGSYDLAPVTLAGRIDSANVTHDSSVTRIDALSSATPFTLAGNQFALMGNNYESTIWVGVFITANISPGLLNSVGYLAYDPNTANNNLNGQPEQFARGFSNDQLYGDRNFDANGDGDFNDTYNVTRPDGVTVTTFENSALANNGYNAARIDPDTAPGSGDTGVDVNADRIRGLGQFTSQNGGSPQANLAWLIQGNATTVVLPEPGSLGLALGALAPLALLATRRARRKAM